METIKNYIIAFLMAVIALLLLTQPAQSAGKSKEAKMIEYAQCLESWSKNADYPSQLDSFLITCAKYRP